MMRHILAAIALVIFPALAQSQSVPDRAALIASIEAAAPAALERHDTPGVGVAMVLGGEPVWSGGFGLSNVETRSPVTGDTVFEIASLTKPVTGWAILKLAEDGRIDLDAPIENYLGGWTLPPSGFDHKGVTARSILAHGAGLSTGGDSGVDLGKPVPTLLEAVNGATMEFGPVRVSQAPGEAYHYSSKGFVLLEMAIENITGESFAQYATREIIVPLGMSDSAFGWTPELEERAAWGHDWYGNRLPHYRHATKAQGGLVATAADVARFVAASLQSGRDAAPGRGIISPASVKETFAPYPFRNDTTTVGLGYNLHTDGEVLVARKGGDHRGYKAMLFSMPDIGAGLVILANSDRAAPGVFADIACPWSQAMPGDPLRIVCGQLHMLRNVHWAAGGIAAVLGLLIGWRVLRGIRLGLRSASAGRSTLRRWGAGLIGLVLILWWVFWYSDIPLRLEGFPPTSYTVRLALWPTAFIWVSWGLSVFLAALMFLVLFPKAGRKSSN